MGSLTASTNLADTYSNSICAMDYRVNSCDRRGGASRFSGVHLQCVDIYMDEVIGRRDCVRTRQHIEKDRARDFILSIPLNGRSYVRQSGVQNCCQPGRSRLLSMAQPFTGTTLGYQPNDSFAQLLIRIPGALLRRDIPGIDDLSNILLDTMSGPGKIMLKMVELGLAEGGMLTVKQAADFGNMLLRAIENAIVAAPQCDAIRDDRGCEPKERLIRMAINFIEANLSNPLLTCAAIADHCQVSERSMQAAFASSLGTTTVAYVREKRLRMCRRDIADPELYATSIIETALRWGFESPAAFSRAYKTLFGRPPSSDKRAAKARG